MARRGDYLYQRPGSTSWWVRFQYPKALRTSVIMLTNEDPGPAFAVSLKTSDRAVAEVRAQPHILRHKKYLLIHAAGSDETTKWGDIEMTFIVTPNTNTRNPDGSQTIATEADVITIAADGTMSSVPNKRFATINFTEEAKKTPVYRDWEKEKNAAKKVLHRDIDSEVVDQYAATLSGKGDDALVKNGLKRFKDVTKGITISNASRADVANFIEAELAERATLDSPMKGLPRTMKMVKYLCAAVNRSMKDARNTPYRVNPFTNPDWSTFQKAYKPTKVPPFSEADLATIKANIAMFRREEYLMLALHIATSVRPVGLYSVSRVEWLDEEEYDTEARKVADHRTRVMYIEHDKDIEYGVRRLPVPQCILDAKWTDGSPLLPEQVDGPLFTTREEYLNRDINSKLDKIGVAVNGKRLYSGRHRGRQRLNSCPFPQITRLIMGHAREVDPHNIYGGYRCFETKRWIDKIKF